MTNVLARVAGANKKIAIADSQLRREKPRAREQDYKQDTEDRRLCGILKFRVGGMKLELKDTSKRQETMEKRSNSTKSTDVLFAPSKRI